MDLKLKTYFYIYILILFVDWKKKSMALKGNDYKQSQSIKHQQNNNSQRTLYILYNLDFKNSEQKHKIINYKILYMYSLR